MSRIYWHSSSGNAALAGAERGWLRLLREKVSRSAWGFSDSGTAGLERALWLLEHAVDPQRSGVGDLMILASVVRDSLSSNHTLDINRQKELLRWLDIYLRVSGVEFRVHGVRLNTQNIDHNTALFSGSAPIALASKIDGWCESHAWIEGPDREAVAQLIQDGLDLRLYRKGMGWKGRYSEFNEGTGVLDLLRLNDSEPVVLSYSVCDSFPNPDCTTWELDDSQAYSFSGEQDEEESEEDWIAERRSEAWSELSTAKKWSTGMEWLRKHRPWARIDPHNLLNFSFGEPLSAYDFLVPDIDSHLAERLKDHPDFVSPETLGPDGIPM